MINSAVDSMLELAQCAAFGGDDALHSALDQLPAAIYVTNAEGVVTYFNPACIDFTGRRPEVGQDRWCVTWRLYTTDGEPLPHEQCPMAEAIASQRAVRDVIAVAERPDGTRVTFRPYPTPMFDENGRFAGAVNVLEDITEEARGKEFLAQARRCRRLANQVSDIRAAETLVRMAEVYEVKAATIRGAARRGLLPI